MPQQLFCCCSHGRNGKRSERQNSHLHRQAYRSADLLEQGQPFDLPALLLYLAAALFLVVFGSVNLLVLLAIAAYKRAGFAQPDVESKGRFNAMEIATTISLCQPGSTLDRLPHSPKHD